MESESLSITCVFFKWCICASGLLWSLTSVYLKSQSIFHTFEFKLLCVTFTVFSWSSCCRMPRNGPFSAAQACTHGHLPPLQAKAWRSWPTAQRSGRAGWREFTTHKIPDTSDCLLKLVIDFSAVCTMLSSSYNTIYKFRLRISNLRFIAL